MQVNLMRIAGELGVLGLKDGSGHRAALAALHKNARVEPKDVWKSIQDVREDYPHVKPFLAKAFAGATRTEDWNAFDRILDRLPRVAWSCLIFSGERVDVALQNRVALAVLGADAESSGCGGNNGKLDLPELPRAEELMRDTGATEEQVKAFHDAYLQGKPAA